MRSKAMVMAKPGDPAWAQLIREIESVVSQRFVEDPDAFGRPYYMPGDSEPGFSFASLNRDDRLSLLAEFVSWRHYECQGIGHAQQRVVIANVLDGKPQREWLEGAFDEATLEKVKVAGFKAMIERMQYSPDNHTFEETDGSHRPWDELSAAAKLQYIARDAACSDVRFEPFAQAVKNTIGDVEEAALRVVLDSQKELHEIASLLPDDGRIEPTPLVEQVKDLLDYVATLVSHQNERLQGKAMLHEGTAEAKPADGKLSLGDVRRGAIQHEKRAEDGRGRTNEAER